jgi:hypothetical protein
VSGLLDNLGTHINPLKLIQQIPKGMPIENLRDRYHCCSVVVVVVVVVVIVIVIVIVIDSLDV